MILKERELIGGRDRLVIERANELKRIEDWLVQNESSTVVLSVSGIGGIGKTTFLSQIEERAHRFGIATARVDGIVSFVNATDFLAHLCRQLGLGDVCATAAIDEMMNQLSRQLFEYKTILLFDHFEEMMPLELFIRTELIPRMPVEGVMMVIASRIGLSMGWRTDPKLITRTERIVLHNFTWQQSIDYIKQAGIEIEDLQQQIGHSTSGYPLGLALAVQSALQEFRNEEDNELFLHEISSDLIREVAPHLNRFVEGLVFLRTSTQDMLSEVLQEEVSLEDFIALGRLSFVRATEKGLVIHDVARTYLLSDLKVRNPQRFDAFLQRTVRALGRMIETATGRWAYDLSQNLVTLCMFTAPGLAFPDASIPMQISTRGLPVCESVMETDVADLHSLIDSGIVAGINVPTLVNRHDLLDLLICNFPESLRVVRHDDGRPAAFATFLPLYKESLFKLPKAIVEVMRENLGKELSKYEQMTLAETDTTLSLISCVPKEAQEYTFFDLLLALKITGWTELALGKRCLLLNTVPEVNTFYLQLGYEHLNPQDINNNAINLFALDFRTKSMGKWLVHLLLGGKAEPMQPVRGISKDMLRSALKYIQNLEMLEQSELAKVLNISGAELHNILIKAISDTPPPEPLSTLMQNILRASFFQSRSSIVSITRSLNIGRTTYYRHLDKALSALLNVIQHQIDLV